MKNTTLLQLLGILFVLLFSGCNKTSLKRYSVKSGTFKSGITESGELQAIRSKMIPMPFIGWKYGWRYKIIHLTEHGEKVKSGDTIAVIDPASVMKVLEQQKSRLESENANLKKLFASHNSALSQLSSELKSEKANRDLIRLQLDKFSFESDKKKELKQLELRIANIKVESLKNKYEKRRVFNEKEIQIQKIRLSQIEKSIREAQIAVDKLKLVSPIDGIVQLERNRRTRSTIQIGDEVHQGANIISIPDMSEMKVWSNLNESDIAKIYLGQQVVTRLDAYPEKAFMGEVSYISKLSRAKQRNSPIKVFDFEVRLTDRDEALKPGMTVSCELILNEIEDALYIENECIFNEESGFFVMEKNSSKKIPVKVLAVNNSFSAISGEIKKGLKLITINDINKQESKDK